jgi:hypothetical protein
MMKFDEGEGMMEGDDLCGQILRVRFIYEKSFQQLNFIYIYIYI